MKEEIKFFLVNCILALPAPPHCVGCKIEPVISAKKWNHLPNDSKLENVMAEEECVRLYKIVLAGDLGVGKTSIFQRYDINKFFENKESTFGLDKLTKDVTVEGKRCKVS